MPGALGRVLASPLVERSPPATALPAGLPVPDGYRQLLAATDGLTTYGGYLRVFGADRLVTWNDPATWKFAWPARLAEYVCFGGTGLGDQYAFRVGSPAVYFLEANTLEAEPSYESFDQFLEIEILSNAEEPYDKRIIAARERFGDLPVDDLVIYTPSPLISGDESVARMTTMSARVAMTINGDLYTQLVGQKGRVCTRLDVVEDDQGRTRIKLVFDD